MDDKSSFEPRTRAGATHRHLTEGPITRTLLVFSLPVLGSNVLQSMNVTANQFWVSHTLGVSAITAISNSNVIMMLLIGAIFGVSTAANILVAQAVGGKNLAQVKKVMGTAITFFFVLSGALAVAGFLLAPLVLDAMRTPAAARAEAIIYLRIVFVAMPFMYFFMFMQMAQRGAGDSRTPFYFSLLAVVLDVILNPLLIRGIGPFPRLGIAGSATSTLIGQGVSLAFLTLHLYRRNSVLAIKPHELRLLIPDLRILNALVLRGMPMGIHMLIMNGSAVVMIGFINHYGAVTAAAYAAASQVWTYIQMPGMALGAAASSMAAQNIGAGKWARVDRVAMSGLGSSLVVTSIMALMIYALGTLPLLLFLPAGSASVPIALHINRMVMWAFVAFNAAFALNGIVRATGAVWQPLVILIFSMWFIRIPFAAIFMPRWGMDAIWWSFPLGTLTSTALVALYYKFGGWRQIRMLEPDTSGQSPDAGQGAPVMDHDADEVVEPEPEAA